MLIDETNSVRLNKQIRLYVDPSIPTSSLWGLCHSYENVTLLPALLTVNKCVIITTKAFTLGFWSFAETTDALVLFGRTVYSRQYKVMVNPALILNTTSACLLMSLTLMFKLLL